MNETAWQRHVQGALDRTLFDDAEPGLAWVALVELLHEPGDSPAVDRARCHARAVGSAAAILERQEPDGYWGSPYAYAARWRGSAWELAALSGLGADPDDPRVARGGEALLHVLRPSAGGFSTSRHRPPAACFTAEMCAALARLGFGHDARVREAIAWLGARQGGDGCWTCPELRHLSGGACPVAAVAALRLAAQFPSGERCGADALAVGAAEWLCTRRLLLEVPHPAGWLDFHHPCLGRTDLLDALYALARNRVAYDERIADGLREVLKRCEAGDGWRQRGTSPHGETPEVGSRWLTLKALVALDAYGWDLDPIGG
jgi:hypothetical protein